MTTDELIEKVIEWGETHGIDNMWSQANKVTEEWGETVGEMTHGRLGDAFEDGIGDTLIALIIYAHICGKDINKCIELSLNTIKKRSGRTVDGNFIKDPDE